MAEYIEREALLQAILDLPAKMDEQGYGWLGRRGVWQMALDFPAADVRPVVRGKWKRVVDFTGVEAFGFKETMVVGWGCNVCGYEVDVSEESFNFCPNCGADMRPQPPKEE